MSENENEEQAAPEAEFGVFAKGNISNIMFFNKNNNINNKINEVKELIDNTEKLNINKTSKKKKLIPRDYQKKIFEKAKNQNSIIYVETGKGKTFISIMLMADLLGIDITNNEKKTKIDKKKKIIFFVCDTALVNQQKKK